MARNFLKLNSEKTEMLLISSLYCKVDSSKFTLDISGTEIQPSSAVRNIGDVFDSCMLLESHVNQICRSLYYNIRNFGAIRKYLTPSTAAHLAKYALIYSYLNSLLISLPDRQLDKLQRIQDITARIVTRCGRTNHVTPVLASLHWLPVRDRICFKVCLMVYHSIRGLVPAYIMDMGSENGVLLRVPHVRTSTYGGRAFSSPAPDLWNSLPLAIRSFDSGT